MKRNGLTSPFLVFWEVKGGNFPNGVFPPFLLDRFVPPLRRTGVALPASHLKMIKLVLLAVLLLAYPAAALGQQTPLTQPEYVRMLYAVEKDPSLAQETIDAVRSRGISFQVTSGVLALTRTKSRNNADLRRALEEADRRRRDPAAARPPSQREADELLKDARESTLAAVADMPDFVVKQLIQRSEAFAGTNNFRNRDRLVVAVSYRATGEEEYRILSINGALQPAPEARRSYEEVGGTSSTGEFVTVLATIFKPESETRFAVVDGDTLRGRRAVMFDFEIDKDRAKQVISVRGFVNDTTISGMKGRLWIDRETGRVLRIESEATEIPDGFPITAARRTVDYDWTTISDGSYLLPAVSDVRLTQLYRGTKYESRNLIRFREYQKFGTEVRVSDEDEEVVPDDN